MDSEILHNLEAYVFYHGTSLEAAESIEREGFRAWFTDPQFGRYAAGGNLGIGVYVTCNWRMALWFGPVLLRVAMRPGTRLLNSALPPDTACIDSLKREFGREILVKSPWKVLPKNKKLKLAEVIALFRYHYLHIWGKGYGKDPDDWWKWSKRPDVHSRRLDDFRSVLIRYGFHGYGNPADDNGIVVFAADRLVLKEMVAEVPPADYDACLEFGRPGFPSLDHVRSLFQRSGSDRAKRLADRIARRETDPAR